MKRWYFVPLILALVSGGCVAVQSDSEVAVQSDSERVVPGGPIVPGARSGRWFLACLRMIS